MSKKSSLLILTIGAVAGWTAARRLFPENDSWAVNSDTYEPASTPPTPVWDARPESPPATKPVVTTGDPFRGAFAGAIAEIESHRNKDAAPETNVA